MDLILDEGSFHTGEGGWLTVSIEYLEVDFGKIKQVVQRDMDEDFRHFYLKQVAKTMTIQVRL